MARQVAWAETAWRDLERIADYIAEDSAGYAAAFVRRVRDHARSLEEMAERGRVFQISTRTSSEQPLPRNEGCRMALVGPGFRPRSRSAWRTQLRSVSAAIPNLDAIDCIAAHCERCSPSL